MRRCVRATSRTKEAAWNRKIPRRDTPRPSPSQAWSNQGEQVWSQRVPLITIWSIHPESSPAALQNRSPRLSIAAIKAQCVSRFCTRLRTKINMLVKRQISWRAKYINNDMQFEHMHMQVRKREMADARHCWFRNSMSRWSQELQKMIMMSQRY